MEVYYDSIVPDELTTTAEIDMWLDSAWHEVWARIPGREDVRIIHGSGVRVVNGGLEVNAGAQRCGPDTNFLILYDWHFPEWLTPSKIYVKHQCDGCHYPPSMCCLQGEDD